MLMTCAKDRRVKVAKLAPEYSISNGNVKYITQEHSGISKVSAWWISKNLNMQDRQQRVESSHELLEVHNANPEDFHTLVTGDETWLHHWDPDTKKDSMKWKCPGSPNLRSFVPNHQPAMLWPRFLGSPNGLY